MEKRRVSSNVTLAGLRILLKALKERAGAKTAVCVTLSLWHYDDTMSEGNEIDEKIGVYENKTGDGSSYFTSLEKAHYYIKTLEKGEI